MSTNTKVNLNFYYIILIFGKDNGYLLILCGTAVQTFNKIGISAIVKDQCMIPDNITFHI